MIVKQSRITIATNGKGIPIKNQNQNFLLRLSAINPVATAKKGSDKMIDIPVKNSIVNIFYSIRKAFPTAFDFTGYNRNTLCFKWKKN